MNKPRQFDNIKQGEIVRYLVETRYYGRRNPPFWGFGVVSHTHLKDFFYVYAPSYHDNEGIRLRRDGMDKPGKGATQIVFRLTPEEKEHPLVKEFLSKKAAYDAAEKELNKTGRVIFSKLENPETNIFPQYPLAKI